MVFFHIERKNTGFFLTVAALASSNSPPDFVLYLSKRECRAKKVIAGKVFTDYGFFLNQQVFPFKNKVEYLLKRLWFFPLLSGIVFADLKITKILARETHERHEIKKKDRAKMVFFRLFGVFRGQIFFVFDAAILRPLSNGVFHDILRAFA